MDSVRSGFPTPIANPMSGYDQYKGTRKSWGINALGSLVVEVMHLGLFDDHQLWTRCRLRQMMAPVVLVSLSEGTRVRPVCESSLIR